MSLSPAARREASTYCDQCRHEAAVHSHVTDHGCYQTGCGCLATSHEVLGDPRPSDLGVGYRP